MTSPDPVMRRLVEVNPAPGGFELPPVSDVALFEEILGRGRVEDSWSRPVLLRSWRRGVVVAVGAFAVVVAIGLLALFTGVLTGEQAPVVTEPPLVTTVAPPPTTVAPVVTTVPPDSTSVPPVVEAYEIVISDRDDGLFVASGPAVDEALACREGTIDTARISKDSSINRESSTVEAYPDDYGALEERTLTCGDGSGAIVLGLLIDQSESMSGYSFSGMWLVASGSGSYERVAGSGTLTGNCDNDRANCDYEYTGHLDRSRTTAGPIVSTRTGRHDVAFNYEGSKRNGLFTATGAAVSSAHFCGDGRMMGLSPIPLHSGGRNTWQHTFFCADGTGRLTLEIDVRYSQYGGQVPTARGTWTVNAGAGAYESVTGSGELSGECVGGIDCSWTYTGYLEILK